MPNTPKLQPNVRMPGITNPDRLWSLDWTVPDDYEPESPIDFVSATLTEIADHFKTDKGTLDHLYTEIYARYFSEFRFSPQVTIVEVGVACGCSLKMWAKYFTHARVIGVDIRPECANLCKSYSNIEIVIADATKEQIPHTSDIFIDDGSHISADIVDTFKRNWGRVKPGGFYVIEDLACTHDETYPKVVHGVHSPDRFSRQHFMGLIDRMLRATDAGQYDVEYIHFYNNLAIIKKIGTEAFACSPSSHGDKIAV